MESDAEQRAEDAGVRTDVTVSPAPSHSSDYPQDDSDLKADPVPTLDPDIAEAQGVDDSVGSSDE